MKKKTAGSVKLNIAANYYLSSSLSYRTTLTFPSIMIFASAKLPYFARGRLKRSFTNVEILRSGLITELFGQGLMIRDFLWFALVFVSVVILFHERRRRVTAVVADNKRQWQFSSSSRIFFLTFLDDVTKEKRDRRWNKSAECITSQSGRCVGLWRDFWRPTQGMLSYLMK